MPVKQAEPQELKGFLGVNLRRDRLNLEDAELARAINADLHTEVGTILTRLGRSRQFSTALTDTVIRRLARINSVRYRAAGRSLYRAQTVILSGSLSANLFTTFQAFRPLNDTAVWAFIADDATMRKDNGTTLHNWGITSPAEATIVVGAFDGSASGDAYQLRLTMLRFAGAAVAHEGNPRAAAAGGIGSGTSVLNGVTDSVAVGDIIHPTDTQIGGFGVYRTQAGGALWLRDTRTTFPTTTCRMGHALPVEAGYPFPGVAGTFQFQFGIPLGAVSISGSSVRAWGTQGWESDWNGASDTASEDTNGRRATNLWELTDTTVTTLTNITTQTRRYSYLSTVADSGLGTPVETDNDVPPEASWVAEFQEHAFLCRDADNPHYLWYSKRFRPEAIPTANFLEIGSPDDPLQCALALAGMLGVFSRKTKYRVTGDVTAGFVPVEAISKRGTPAPGAAIVTESGIVFVARDGIFRTNLIAADDPLAEEILPLFLGESVNDYSPISWDAAATMAAAFYKGRYYLSLPTGTQQYPDLLAVYSATTKKWYFYDHPMRSLLLEEDTDDLTGGGTDGFVYVLEDPGVNSDAGSGIALSVETADRYGAGTVLKGASSTIRKLFLWLRVDASLGSGTLTVDLYVDGTLKRTTTITGTRTRQLIPFPVGTLGYAWRARFRATGTIRMRVYGCAALWMPLELA